MKRTEWQVLTIARPLGPTPPFPFAMFGGRIATVTRFAQHEWRWDVRENSVTKPRASGVAGSRKLAIVKANRAAFKLGWATGGAGLSARKAGAR